MEEVDSSESSLGCYNLFPGVMTVGALGQGTIVMVMETGAIGEEGIRKVNLKLTLMMNIPAIIMTLLELERKDGENWKFWFSKGMTLMGGLIGLKGSLN